jgi:hypothetical protein
VKHLSKINKFAKDKVLKYCTSERTTFEILDVQQMSAQRRDAVCRETKYGTTDCAHFCRPGIPDWWNLELLKKLSEFYTPV